MCPEMWAQYKVWKQHKRALTVQNTKICSALQRYFIINKKQNKTNYKHCIKFNVVEPQNFGGAGASKRCDSEFNPLLNNFSYRKLKEKRASTFMFCILI
jgi:hypothetical protein